MKRIRDDLSGRGDRGKGAGTRTRRERAKFEERLGSIERRNAEDISKFILDVDQVNKLEILASY